jgi:anti-sigma-K factor RskA
VVRAANDALRFLLELSALAAVAYWGWSEGGGARWVLVVVAPLVVVLVWGRWMAPRSNHRVRDPWGLVIELLVFGSAVAALAAADQSELAIILAGAAALHVGLTFPLTQRQ